MLFHKISANSRRMTDSFEYGIFKPYTLYLSPDTISDTMRPVPCAGPLMRKIKTSNWIQHD